MKTLFVLCILSIFANLGYNEPTGDFRKLLKKLEAEHKIYSFTPAVADGIQVPQDATTKALELLRSETADDMRHTVDLVFRRSNDGNEQKPWFFVFQAESQNGDQGAIHYFKSDLEGNLLLAMRSSGKIDEAGNKIKGTGTVDYPDLNAPETKARFQHELDFWLKGAYRKKKAPAKPADSPKSAEKTK